MSEPKTKIVKFMDVTDDVLQDMVRAIVAAVHPEKVILFGSYARGEAGEHSDIDLAIVEAEGFDAKRTRWNELRRIRDALKPFFVPKDILVFSKAEESKAARFRSHILTTAKEEGRVLYERE